MLKRSLRRAFSFEKLHGKMDVRKGFNKEIHNMNSKYESKFLRIDEKIKLYAPYHKKKIGFWIFMVFTSYNFELFQWLAIQLEKTEPLTDFLSWSLLGAEINKQKSFEEFKENFKKVRGFF
jgi:hypothetical protein